MTTPPSPCAGGGGVGQEGLLAELTTLNAGAAQHLAVLLLGHALATLLDNGTHRVYLAFVEVVRTKPANVQFGLKLIADDRVHFARRNARLP